MGGRGARSGGGGSAGEVVIRKQPEPNKQGYSYYMTGTRNILSNWDDNGNYHESEMSQVRFLYDPLRINQKWR